MYRTFFFAAVTLNKGDIKKNSKMASNLSSCEQVCPIHEKNIY